MSTISLLGIENTSLGTLERLPAELRNQIYELSITTGDESEVDFHEPCRRPCNLFLASKQIYDECKGFLAEIRGRPCTHINYRATIKRQDYEIADLYPKHNIVQAHTIRFITGHLTGQAPLAVTLNLPRSPGLPCEVFGASKGRTKHVLWRVMDQMANRALHFEREVDVQTRDLEKLARTIIMASMELCAEKMILVVSSGKGRVSGRVDVL